MGKSVRKNMCCWASSSIRDKMDRLERSEAEEMYTVLTGFEVGVGSQI